MCTCVRLFVDPTNERTNERTTAPITWKMHGHGVSTTAPACHGHSAVAHGDCIYVYGGDAKDNRRISDLYKFSISTATTPMPSLERMHKREIAREAWMPSTYRSYQRSDGLVGCVWMLHECRDVMRCRACSDRELEQGRYDGRDSSASQRPHGRRVQAEHVSLWRPRWPHSLC